MTTIKGLLFNNITVLIVACLLSCLLASLLVCCCCGGGDGDGRGGGVVFVRVCRLLAASSLVVETCITWKVTPPRKGTTPQSMLAETLPKKNITTTTTMIITMTATARTTMTMPAMTRSTMTLAVSNNDKNDHVEQSTANQNEQPKASKKQ